jgi:hypothetical protein
MRHLVFILGMILIWASAAFAQDALAQDNIVQENLAQENPVQANPPQENPAYARLLATPYFSLAPLAGANATPLALAAATSPPAPFTPAANASPASPAADPPQGVQGVFVNYNWQAYFGYTFFRFYEVPGRQLDTNGFNFSMQYYFTNWFGLDGEFAATETTQSHTNGWFLFGGGGPRFRWSGPRGLELWGHVLVGYSNFTPQTPFGGQTAFAYTAGGGGDINILRSRWALRLGADMVATRYFSTYQYSPKAFAGIVFKF